MVVCLLCFRYDCNATIGKGRILISPGDLTHIHKINPVTRGKFEFISSKFGGGDVLCQEVHGRYQCPGFDPRSKTEKWQILILNDFPKVFK